MFDGQTASNLYNEYRTKAESGMSLWVALRSKHPYASFPNVSALVWRHAVLAELWGSVATKLSGGKKDYLNEWRTGR